MYKKHFYHYLDQNESFNMLLLSMLIFCLFNFALFKTQLKKTTLYVKRGSRCVKNSQCHLSQGIYLRIRK